ncbi:hypothetical protein HDU76_013539 [Blyttiomyces sp. JEL0837]|nr:hypothetical protein HDU76_013539 [Blyttiomyces sp. JEL0837]
MMGDEDEILTAGEYLQREEALIKEAAEEDLSAATGTKRPREEEDSVVDIDVLNPKIMKTNDDGEDESKPKVENASAKEKESEKVVATNANLEQDATCRAINQETYLDATKTFHEIGMRELNRIDRIQAIEGVHAVNELGDALKEFLKRFAERGVVVTESDVKGFFEELKMKKRRVG